MHHRNNIQVAYSFPDFNDSSRRHNSNKVGLDILFMPPENKAPASVRVAQSNPIWCQAKKVAEAIVHREVQSFLFLPLFAYDYV